MTDPYPPDSKQANQSPSPRWRARLLAGGCLVAALGLHWLVLSWQLPQHPQPDPTPTAKETSEDPLNDISVTVLPQSNPTPAAEPSSPTPSPIQPSPSPLPPISPAPPSPQLPTPVPVQTMPPLEPADQEPDLLEPEVLVEETLEPESDLEPDPESDPEPSEPSPYADFPHLAGAEATCEGVTDCWRSPASSWRSASTDLKSRLENAGYTLTNITGEVLNVDTGVRVYAVKQGEEVAYYLNLVSVAGGVLYTMTQEPITSEMVSALQGD